MNDAFTFVNFAVINYEKTQIIVLCAVFAVLLAVTAVLAASVIKKKKP